METIKRPQTFWIRLALIIAGISVIVFSSCSARACDSYEECMKEPAKWSYEEKTAYATRAIAYKLDEISKKLDSEPAHSRAGDKE